MQRKLFQLILICITLTAAVRFGQPLQARAASAAIGFLLQETEISVGDTVGIYLTIDAEVGIGDFEGYISYDSDFLEFKTASSNVAGGDGILKVSDIYSTSSDTSKKYLIKFTALKPGTTEVYIMNQPQVYEYETSYPMSVSSTAVSLTIASAQEASDNALLDSLKISPGTLEPGFSPEVFEYTATVSMETESMFIAAVAQDENAHVTISGNSPLYTGVNEVHVFVTAETGKIQEYLIYVTRPVENTPTPTVAPTPTELLTPTEEPLPEEVGFEWKLEATQEDGAVLIEGKYQFNVCELPEGVEIPAGYQKTKLMISGITITAYAPSGSNGSDFVLLCLKKEGQEAKLYRYDRVEKTIQRFVTEDIVVTREEGSDTGLAQSAAEEYERNVTTMGLIIAALTAVWLVTIIGLIYFYMKSKGMKDELD